MSRMMRLAAVATCCLLAAAASAAEDAMEADGPSRPGEPGNADTKKVEMSIPPAAQQAIDRGLAYLARTQRKDGSWPTEYGRTTAVVGSCALAFLSSGHLPGRGRYGATVERAVSFLLRSARSDGLLYQEGMVGSPMYHHGIAALALAEAWGMCGDADGKLKETLSRAVQLAVATQNRRGGWRYRPRIADDDMSVTMVQMLALRAARDVGIYVPKQTSDAGLRYIRSCHHEQTGTFSYQPGGRGGLGMTSAGVLSLQLAGKYDDPQVVEGLKTLLRMFFGRKVGTVHYYYYYTLYYASQAVYQAQSSIPWGIMAWNAFYPALARELIAKQMATGAWQSLYDEYGTAQAILMLSIPNRYLPIYQR